MVAPPEPNRFATFARVLADLDAPLAPGQIRNSNGPMIRALVAETGCEVVDLGIARDDEDALEATLLDAAARCDAIVANMTPFRGPSMDAGTCYEMGLAKGLGKLVVGWTEDRRRWQEKVALVSPLVADGDWFRDADGNLCRELSVHGKIVEARVAAGKQDLFRNQ